MANSGSNDMPHDQKNAGQLPGTSADGIFLPLDQRKHLDKRPIYSAPTTRSALSNPAALMPVCLTA
jgi:hypothetical protein